jgi:glycosyltransferase involved in cell wall biosynthesis
MSMKKSPKSKRIVIYSHSFWPAIGGVETYAKLISEGLATDPGFEPVVITQTPYDGPEPDTGALVLRSPRLWRLWQEIANADVVFVAGPALVPMVISALFRRPFVIEHHGYQAICPNGLLLNKVDGEVCQEAFRNERYHDCVKCVSVDHGRRKALLQVALTFARRWLCTRAVANVAVTQHVRTRHDLVSMQVIYHGIPDTSHPATIRQFAPRPDSVHFAYVGRLSGEKGLPLLIQAAAKVKESRRNFKLSFIGDGPMRDELSRHVAALGLESDVRFTGFLAGATLQSEVESVDVVVMPSIWEETAGLAAMEQMMRGKAVLAANIGGLGEVVGTGGIRFQPFDASDLAARMMDLLWPEHRREIGRAGRERAERLFQLNRMVEDHKAIFRNAYDAL